VRRLIALLAALLASVTVARAQQVDPVRAVAAWSAHDARLIGIGWRLAKANAPFCAQRQAGIGMVLTDFRRFEDPAATARAVGAATGVAVSAVAPGSPAERAGVRGGDAVLAVEGAPPAPGRDAKDRRAADLLDDRIDAALAARGRVVLRLAAPGAAGRDVTVTGETVCRARFSLIGGGTLAMSEGYAIRVSAPLFAAFASDDEAATILAHELAHNALDHVRENNAAGRAYLVVRRNEREADRLAPWLMANAGFDPAAAPRFIAAWGPKYGGGITRSPSHDHWRERAALMAGELPQIAAAQAASGGRALDWRSRFAN
jgi:membrane-associated protease RseP (regulator of RpoE activity)